MIKTFGSLVLVILILFVICYLMLGIYLIQGDNPIELSRMAFYWIYVMRIYISVPSGSGISGDGNRAVRSSTFRSR